MPMYNLIEYSSNYSETTGSLCFYSKAEVNNFNADILSANRNDNNKDNANNIIFTIKDTKLYAPVITLSARDNQKLSKVKRYYLPKIIINNYNVNINLNKFYDQANNSEEIRKLTTRQCEDYTSRCLLDYDYTRNHYRLIAVDLNRQK